jgi:undecaprenyl-diphosphatase
VTFLLALFALMGALVHVGHGVSFDAPILGWLHAHQTPGRTRVARALVRIGDPATLAVATVLVVAGLAALSRLRAALGFTLQVAGAGILDAAAKALFARPWPSLYPPMLPRSGYAFPSGHSVAGAAFFLALQLLSWRSLPGVWRWAGMLGLLLALAIGGAVCYLQLHFPSDVLAGWALGGSCTLVVQRLVRAPLGRD